MAHGVDHGLVGDAQEVALEVPAHAARRPGHGEAEVRAAAGDELRQAAGERRGQVRAVARHLRAQDPDRPPDFAQAQAHERASLLHLAAHGREPGLRRQDLEGGVELHAEAGQALGQRVVQLARDTRALAEHGRETRMHRADAQPIGEKQQPRGGEEEGEMEERAVKGGRSVNSTSVGVWFQTPSRFEAATENW